MHLLSTAPVALLSLLLVLASGSVADNMYKLSTRAQRVTVCV